VGGLGSVVGGKKILWAREKSGKELKIRNIKNQQKEGCRRIGVSKTLYTTFCARKKKRTTYSKVVHMFVMEKYARRHKKTPPLGGVFLESFKY